MVTSPSHRRLHFGRRQLLAGSAGLGVSQLARACSVAADRHPDPGAPPPSIILLWLQGGPSQLETFDPHPGTLIGGDTRAIRTSAGSVRIAGTLPKLAEQMHHATLVRSLVGQEGDHQRAQYHLQTGFRPDATLTHPSIGSILCHADDQSDGHDNQPRGRRSTTEIPRHISILPEATSAGAGYLGAAYDPFRIGDPKQRVPDVRPAVDEARYARRIDDLRSVVEPEFLRGRLKSLEADRTLHLPSIQAARRLMSSEQLVAFEVDREPIGQQLAFGQTPFGRGVLAAARLIEVGVRCVEVTLGGWDTHINNHEGQAEACSTLDPALAALIDRLAERRLLESTVVVCTGEFGRTPKINAAAGRDHWVQGFSTLIAGGRFRRGHVHGATSAEVREEESGGTREGQSTRGVEDPATVSDLHATIVASLGLETTVEWETPVGRPMKRSDGRVIGSLLQPT